MSFYRKRILLEGVMPERALLKLRRAQIPLYRIEKPKPNQILFQVRKQDAEKIFAIYSKAGAENYRAYQVKDLGAIGLGKWIETAQRRVGLLLGGLLGLSMILASQPLVLAVEFVGTSVYARETYQALDEAGVKLFAPYKPGQEDSVCAKLLAIEDVEFCSVKKVGHRIVVETRLSPFSKKETQAGVMRARCAGEIVSMAVLRGTPLVKIGDTVREGDILAGDWFSTESGGQVRVEIIARVCIACTYEIDVEAEDEETAFAKAYLSQGFTDQDTIQQYSVERVGDLYRVQISFHAIEIFNL
ncbi:MAG: hypothetical protein E7371_04310 [Clostridiales bacterium]|nr:hypothetical protein [Clostridiales bacterium]